MFNLYLLHLLTSIMTVKLQDVHMMDWSMTMVQTGCWQSPCVSRAHVVEGLSRAWRDNVLHHVPTLSYHQVNVVLSVHVSL